MSDGTVRSKRGLIKIRPQGLGEESPTPEKRSSSSSHRLWMTPKELEMRIRIAAGPPLVSPAAAFSRSSLQSIENDETAALQRREQQLKDRAKLLCTAFLDSVQSRTTDSEVFDTIRDLMHLCDDALQLSESEWQRWGADDVAGGSQNEILSWLEAETKTWNLLHALYRDRVLLQTTNEEMDVEEPLLGASEKEVVVQLFLVNATLREYQIVVDWLEASHKRSNAGLQIGHATDRKTAFENTLYQLQRGKGMVAFGRPGDIVQHLDPDAPTRERRPLHALDEEDNRLLAKSIFVKLRQGAIDEAMGLCQYCGQTWRAALLEGWRLHEDPNYDPCKSKKENRPVEGNPRRDLWKRCAWQMASSRRFDEFTRAIAGVFCGHLESLRAIMGSTWEDLLWAYLKVQIDIRVESEVRSTCVKSYLTMPDAYWNSKMSLDAIFNELAAHRSIEVRSHAKSIVATIQRHIILDNPAQMLNDIRLWIDTDAVASNPDVRVQMLRFFTHVVLFFKQLGRIDDEECADRIIETYVTALIASGDAALVSFYASALPPNSQTRLYSQFLEGVTGSRERTTALVEAQNAGLDVEGITRFTVNRIRTREQPTPEITKAGEISEWDRCKISALEYLHHLAGQRGELLWQANALTRHYLAEGKTECVRATLDMVPRDSMSQLLSVYGQQENFPAREECAFKEFLCYRFYLTAIDAFEEWSNLFHKPPKQPNLDTVGATFTERMAIEHRETCYRADVTRYRLSLEDRMITARAALEKVLLFPDHGWLVDPDTHQEPLDPQELTSENRHLQMERLRSIFVPECVLLLHTVLHQSGEFRAVMRLAEQLASERHQLYKVYTKHKLAEVLAKIAESSVELLNLRKDPFGFGRHR